MIRKTVALYFKRAVPFCDKKDLSRFVLKNCRTLFLLKENVSLFNKKVSHIVLKKELSQFETTRAAIRNKL